MLGILYDLLVALVVAAFALYVAWRLLRRESPGVPALLLGFAALVAVYASFIEPRMLTVHQYETKIGDGGRSLRLAVISDTHLGQFRHAPWLAKVVATINAQHPDAVLVAGDIASTPVGIREFAPFADLKSTYGTYAVLGNWDYRAGAVDVREAIQSFPVKMLVNKSVLLGATGVRLLGLDDIEFGRPDWNAALADAKPGEVEIALVHNPDLVRYAEVHGVNLVVAGHTHCGQVRLPLIGPVPPLPTTIGRQFDCGVFDYGKTSLFITPGVGESSARPRLFDPPEVSILTVNY